MTREALLKELRTLATEAAHEISGIDSKAARWIADDALRELGSDGVQRRLRRRAKATRSRS